MQFVRLLVAMLVLVKAQAQDECGPYVVQMKTREGPPCRLRFNTDQVDKSSDLTRNTIASARAVGDAKYQQELQREKNIVQEGLVVKQKTPEYQHYLFNAPTNSTQDFFQTMLQQKHQAMAIGEALTSLYGLDRNLSGDVLLHLNLSVTEPCTPTPICQESDLYRSYDGSCNNLKHPKWGMRLDSFSRLLLPVYGDGIYTPRRATDGSELPNIRKLSITLFQDHNAPSQVNTLMTMQWGQLVAHDVAGSSNQVGASGVGLSCCTEDRQSLDSALLSQGCYPIEIPADDPFFSKYNQRCMSTTRSKAAYDMGCQLSAAAPNNFVNMIMDCTFVHGWNKEVADSLRTFQGGRLLTQMHHGRSFMPQEADATVKCDRLFKNDTCFRSGELSVNQNTQLSLLQNVMLREHNRIVDELARINPHWNDEKLYQEGRKILAAIFQHITYKEMVPIYVGKDFAEKFGLMPLTSGYKEGYDEEILISTFNSFTAGSYRGFHGLIQGSIKMVDYKRCPVKDVQVSTWMNQPRILLKNNNYDQLLLGLVTQPSQEADEFFTSDQTNKLFRMYNKWGQDLAAIDILRNRDTGLPPYNDFRVLCGLKRATQWSDFTDWISVKLVDKMSKLYSHPDDVDLTVGGFLEKPLPGALQGPTFQCITGEQFYRYKFGDRFFYEFKNHGHEFTPEQLQEIRKATVSRLICDNGDNIKSMQLEGFWKISSQNKLYSCSGSRIPRVNLTKWKQ